MEYPTAAKARELTVSIQESLGLLEVGTPSPSSDLGRILRELQWLGGFEDPLFTAAGATKRELKGPRLGEALLLFFQADRIARALEGSRTIPGVKRTDLARLRKQLNRLTSQAAPAQDVLFELELAGRLYGCGLRVEFDEPDLRVNSLEGCGSWGIACKRPRTVEGIENVIRSGRDQVRRSGIPGIVAVDIEAIVHGSGDPVRRTSAYFSQHIQELAGLFHRHVDALTVGSSQKIAAQFADGALDGVAFCGELTGWAKRPAEGGMEHRWQWFVRVVPNLSSSTAGRCVSLFKTQWPS